MVITVVLLIAFIVLFQPSSNHLRALTASLEQTHSIERDGQLLLVQVVHRRVKEPDAERPQLRAWTWKMQPIGSVWAVFCRILHGCVTYRHQSIE